MNEYPYGHDFGNSEADGVTFYHGQERSCTMPSAESTANQSAIQNLGIRLAPTTALLRMTGEDTVYIIGEDAYTQGTRVVSTRGDMNRYSSKASIRACLANACRMIPDKKFRLRVTTGVPVKTYVEDNTIRDKVSQGLSGTYSFCITYTTIYDGIPQLVREEERVVEIVVEKVIMEGAGVIIGYGESSNVLQAAVDFGGRTCDIYVSNGQTPQAPLCKSEILGVESAIEILKTNFRAVYERDLKQREARQMMRAYATRLSAPKSRTPYPDLIVFGEEIPSIMQEGLVSEAIEKVGESLASFIASTLSEGETTMTVAASIKTIFPVGRGVYYFQPFLERVVRAKQIKQVDDPGTANAYGYASLSRKAIERYQTTY